MTDICTVCGEPADENASALCNGCNQPFHLAVRPDSESKECGRVWVNEQFMTLEYGCFRCLGEAPAASVDGAAFTERRAPGKRRYRKVR